MKRSVKLDLSWRAWSLIVGFFILIGFVGLSIAYNANGVGGNPAIMGHSADEISGVTGGNLVCKNTPNYYNTNGNTACLQEFGSDWICVTTGDDKTDCTATYVSLFARCCKIVGGVASSDTGADYVVDSWHASDGTSWYRKWKSGWIEQGGWISSSSSSVTFPTPFADSCLSFIASKYGAMDPCSYYFGTDQLTKTGAVIIWGYNGWGCSGTAITKFYWEAKGY